MFAGTAREVPVMYILIASLVLLASAQAFLVLTFFECVCLLRWQVGDSKRAIVQKVEDFGAFVSLLDVPNVSGLVHKSELSWDTFLSVDDVIKAGVCGRGGGE